MGTRAIWVEGKKGRLSSREGHGDLSFNLKTERKPCKVIITVYWGPSSKGKAVKEVMQDIIDYAGFNIKKPGRPAYKVKINQLAKDRETVVTIGCESLYDGKGVVGHMQGIIKRDKDKGRFPWEFEINR